MKFIKNYYPPYIVLSILYLFMIIFAFILNSPSEIFAGIKAIIFSPDILITDYIQVGGIGATLINAAMTSFLSMFMLIYIGIKPNGSTLMSLWLMTGFSFLGKNIFNIWPIIFGVYLFSKYEKEPFLNYTLVALLGTSLAPVVSQLSFGNRFPNIIGISLGILLGIIVGFILPPIAAHCMKAHNGYNLYNIGFASGLLATLLMSIIRALGINFSTRLLWSTGSNKELLIFLLIICTFLIVLGLILGKPIIKNLIGINNQSGRLISDFYFLFGATTYINMGILGLLSTLFVVLVNADLNGATLCGIFTIIGFGAFGKNVRNVVPVITGAVIASLFNVNPINSPTIILSILFSTTLAPISGKFGWKMGIVAGIMHICIVANVGYLHGGLNLYNNGLAGGIVAMILLPLITAFKKEV